MPAMGYTLTYFSPTGSKITDMEVSSLNLARRENEVGSINLVFPGGFAMDYFRPEGLFELNRWLTPSYHYLEGDTAWLIRRVRMAIDGSGTETVEVSGVDLNDILRRRIVAYPAGTAYTEKTDYCDDCMKDMVKENLGSMVLDASRNLGARLLVAPDQGLGPIVYGDYAYRNLLDVFTEMVGQARDSGIRMVFNLAYLGNGVVEFRTHKNYSGTNRGTDSQKQVLFSFEDGSLTEPELIADYLDEYNYVYAGGPDEAGVRDVQEAYDGDRIGLGPFARTEFFIDANQSRSSDSILAVAKAYLSKGRPRLLFNGRLVDSPGTQYGQDYRYGDRVACRFAGVTFNAVLDTLGIQYGSQGEMIDARIHSEAYF